MEQRIHLVCDLPGPKCAAVKARSKQVEPASMSEQVPVVWDEAERCYVKDLDGNVFLDFSSGVLVANAGHSHPAIVKAVQEQAAKVINCYDFPTEARVKLAEKLVEITPEHLEWAFLLSTGSESTEAAIKLARKFTGKYEIISFWGAFHGRTYGAMTIGGKHSGSGTAGFGPFLPGVHHVPFPYCYRCPFGKTYPDCKLQCFTFLEEAYDYLTEHRVAAVIVETYQGGAGSIIAPAEWWRRLQDWCRKHEALLIIDEVQASFGRTGKLFGFEHYGVEPDLLCLGKGISSSLPVAALMGRGEMRRVLPPGSLSSTHGGNPLGAVAALANIEVILKEKLAANAAELGRYALERLQAAAERYPILGQARGMGLALALEIVESPVTRKPSPKLARALVEYCYQRGLLLIAPIGTFGNCVRIAPPLVITKNELAQGLDILEAGLKELSEK